MSNTWTRPTSVDYPTIWTTFTAKHPETQDVWTFQVRDLPEERFDEAEDIMIENFLAEEEMCKSKGISNDPASLFMAREYYRRMLEKKITLICTREGSDEIVGINVLEPAMKDDEKIVLPEGTDASVLDLLIASEFVMKNAAIYEKYAVDKYISAWGLFVFPKYRGMGIGGEILKARKPLGKAVGFSVTATQFTSSTSQAVAKKSGFTEDFAISYEDMGKKEPFVVFHNMTSPQIKVMSLRIE
uniref:N-acetyltransferase domain-containing protein n=1 Tax=Nyssomyia neivai TaxID=330878 RepID=A0A1L8DAK4_9DIPT